MGTTAQDEAGVLCTRCKEPLPLWSLEAIKEDLGINFIRPPVASHPVAADIPTSEAGEMHRPAPPVTHTISPVSDLIVSLNHEDGVHRYLVSSQILRVVSPVWRKYLDPNTPFQKQWTDFVDGRQHIVMELEDDDPDTLLAVLNVLHFVTENIPTTIDFAQLRSFAVLCDKYDCAMVLKMWSKTWLDQWASLVLEPGYEDWLFIAKVFLDDRNVKDLEALLVEESSSLSLCGSYFLRRGTEVSTALLPEIMLKRIAESREKELKRQIGVWRRFLQTYVSDNVAKGCPNEDCVTLSYGSLIRSVEQSSLVKVFHMTEEWHGTIKDFEAQTANIRLSNGTRFHGYGWCPVENLNISLRNQLKRPME